MRKALLDQTPALLTNTALLMMILFALVASFYKIV